LFLNSVRAQCRLRIISKVILAIPQQLRCDPHRSGAPEDQRYRQPPDGRSYPGRQGRKDRDVMLSPKLLDAPRVYWRGLRRKPTNGCSRATDGIRRVIRSPPRFSGTAVRRPPNVPVLSTSLFNPTLSPLLSCVRNFGFLANRQRATLLPLCFRLPPAI